MWICLFIVTPAKVYRSGGPAVTRKFLSNWHDFSWHGNYPAQNIVIRCTQERVLYPWHKKIFLEFMESDPPVKDVAPLDPSHKCSGSWRFGS
jgi:hypothetical protein